MRVRLTTTISLVVEVNPENTSDFETAKREILGRYGEALDQDAEQEQYIEAVQALQTGAVVHDSVIANEVAHRFELLE